MGDCPLSKRALKFISSTIGDFLEKGEIVTNHNTDVETYEKACKKVRKMVKNLPSKPEKYLDYDYLTGEKVDEIEKQAEEWEMSKHGRY